MASYRRFVFNAVATLGGRIANVLLALVLSTLLFRWLGAARYGIWSFVYVLVSYSSIVDLGLSTTIERFVARSQFQKDREGIENGLNLALTLAGGFSLVLETAVLLTPGSFWRRFPGGEDFRLLANALPLCLLFSNAATVVGAGLAGVQRMGRLNVIRSEVNGARSLLVLVLAACGLRRVDLLLLVYSVGGVAAAFWCWRALEGEVGRVRFRPFYFERGLAREYFRFGSAVQVASLFCQAGDQLLRVLIGSRFGLPWMGFYDLGTRAAAVLRAFASVLLAVMVPFGTEKHLGEDSLGISRLYRFSVKYLALFMIPGTALSLYYSQDIIALWLKGSPGAEMVLAVFRVFLVGNLLAVLGGPAIMIGRSANRPQTEAILTVAGVSLGLLSAAFASGFLPAVALYAVGSLGAPIAIWVRLRGLLRLGSGVGKDLLRILGCAAVMLVATICADRILGSATALRIGWGSVLRLALTVGLSGVILLTVAWNTRAFTDEEKAFWLIGLTSELPRAEESHDSLPLP